MSKPAKKTPSSKAFAKIVFVPVGSIKVIPAIRDAVLASSEDRKRLWDALDRDGIQFPGVMTSDGVGVDLHGRLEWAKARGVKTIPVKVRPDLNYERDPVAVEIAAHQYARERRNMTKGAIRKSEKRERLLEKARAREKMSEGGKKSAETAKAKREGKAAPPKSVAPRNRSKKQGRMNSDETLRKSQDVEDAWKAGNLPIGELEDKDIISTDRAHQVLKATVEPERRTDFIEKQTEIVKTVLALPVSEQKTTAMRRIRELLGKPKKSKVSKKTDDTSTSASEKPKVDESAKSTAVSSEPELTDKPQDVGALIARCQKSVVELTTLAEDDFDFTDDQKAAIDDLLADLRSAESILAKKSK